MKPRLTALILGALLLPGAAPAADVPTPESVLGFKVGEDRKLADWNQIVDYFKKLDAASDRVIVEEVGKTTEGRPFLIATISAEANMKRLEEIRRANLRLSDPRGLSEEEARRLVAEGKTIVAHNHGIHSTEVAAPQTSMELAYTLATSQDPQILEILDKTVIVMIPSHNPDGTQMVVDWYKKTLGTPYEGGNIPFLYHKYVGHDNNRDWYMFSQVESQLTVKHLYDRWRPQIVHDLHQMGQRGARIFAPPYVDPWEPNVDSSLRAAVNDIGSHMAARLTAEGKKGAVIHAMYDGWTPARAYPHTHGGVRILTECASVRIATPLELKFDQLGIGIGYDAKRATWNFPDPWPGGSWRLRDIVDYQMSASKALLEHAARNREYWLRNFLEVNRRAAARTEPYAFVFTAEQKDPLAAAKLLGVMRMGSVEVQRAKAPFEAGGRAYPAGSHVILMQQPFSAFAKSLLERQQYPDIRQYPGGPPQRPYDVTAHTLPMLMGVEAVAVPAAFKADLQTVADVVVPAGRVEGKGRSFALGHKSGELIALGRLLKDGVAVRWATEAFSEGGRSYPAGTLLVPASAQARLAALAKELGLVARGVGASPKALALRSPRVGLYQSWFASMDEGWTRFVFEKQLGLPYESIHDKDVRAGNLKARLDAIVLADQPPRQIVTGHAPGSMPEEYVGGLGKEGVQNLKAFVEAGGTLVTLGASSNLPIAEFGIPVTNVLAAFMREPRAEGEPLGPDTAEFYCPGAILRVQVEGTSPISHGMESATPIWFESSPAFEVKSGTVVARYADENPLLSGWLLGDKLLRGKAALVEEQVGQGRVVLFGFRPQYRAQSWATYIPFLNALYMSSATPAR